MKIVVIDERNQDRVIGGLYNIENNFSFDKEGFLELMDKLEEELEQVFMREAQKNKKL